MKIALSGNIEELNHIIKILYQNNQLLIEVADTLKRKGIKPQVP